MYSNLVFHTLEQVDSTNNYAMAQIHDGFAKHGMAWFALNQTTGKGQRGKNWESEPGENIVLSVAVVPPASFQQMPFLFNALISLTIRSWMEGIVNENVKIKWPNDMFIRDRKAGGVLIENIYRGSSWNWSVIGVGINVNQTAFVTQNIQPTSFSLLTEKRFDAEALAKSLHQKITEALDTADKLHPDDILKTYNMCLFKCGEPVVLIHQNKTFKATILGVNKEGILFTQDTELRNFRFGEVEWVMGEVGEV
jgi:BirA family biotin operon repressor/biotin-[acetyl-CoA-carboxylase] ligase